MLNPILTQLNFLFQHRSYTQCSWEKFAHERSYVPASMYKSNDKSIQWCEFSQFFEQIYPSSWAWACSLGLLFATLCHISQQPINRLNVCEIMQTWWMPQGNQLLSHKNLPSETIWSYEVSWVVITSHQYSCKLFDLDQHKPEFKQDQIFENVFFLFLFLNTDSSQACIWIYLNENTLFDLNSANCLKQCLTFIFTRF